MASLDIIQAGKDDEYRLSLSKAERAPLPDHPTGLSALTDAELDAVTGGYWKYIVAGAAAIPGRSIG